MQAQTVIPKNFPYDPADMRTGRPAKTTRTAFGKRLHQARTAAGLSQTQVAELLGLSQSGYAAWERENVALRPDQVSRLCSILRVKVEELFEDGPSVRRTGPAGKARLMFEAVSRLPRRQQEKIFDLLEPFITAHAR